MSAVQDLDGVSLETLQDAGKGFSVINKMFPGDDTHSAVLSYFPTARNITITTRLDNRYPYATFVDDDGPVIIWAGIASLSDFLSIINGFNHVPVGDAGFGTIPTFRLQADRALSLMLSSGVMPTQASWNGTIRIYGWSGGGANAQVLACFVKQTYPNATIKCHTFGNPKPLDRRGVALLQNTQTLLWWNFNDLIPSIPPTEQYYRTPGAVASSVYLGHPGNNALYFFGGDSVSLDGNSHIIDAYGDQFSEPYLDDILGAWLAQYGNIWGPHRINSAVLQIASLVSQKAIRLASQIANDDPGGGDWGDLQTPPSAADAYGRQPDTDVPASTGGDWSDGVVPNAYGRIPAASGGDANGRMIFPDNVAWNPPPNLMIEPLRLTQNDRAYLNTELLRSAVSTLSQMSAYPPRGLVFPAGDLPVVTRSHHTHER